MSSLDRLLAIPDKAQRQSAMVKYAKSLDADPVAAHQKGNCNEEILAILIYDAEQKNKTRRSRDIKFVGGGIVVLVILIALIGTTPKLFVSIFKREENTVPKEKTLQAFDKKGKPVMEDNQPVLYKLMDGVYEEPGETKDVHYEYTYDSGKVISKKTLNRKGKVIAEDRYDTQK